MKHSSSRGASTTTLIVALAAIGILCLLISRIGPIFWNEKSLQSALDSMTVADIVKMTQEDAVQTVINAGKDAGVPLTVEQVSIEYGPEENKITIRVKYTATADMVVTQYKRDIAIISNPIGSPKEAQVRKELGAPQPSPQQRPSPSAHAPSQYVAPPGGPFAGRARDAGKKLPSDEP